MAIVESCYNLHLKWANQSYLSIPKFVRKHNILGKKTGGFKNWIISAADAGIYRLKKYDRVLFCIEDS